MHVLKNYLSAEQKRELGDKLIAAVAEVENLVNSDRHQETSWVHVYAIPTGHWGMDAHIPNWDAARAYFVIESAEDAARVFQQVMGTPIDPATVS